MGYEYMARIEMAIHEQRNTIAFMKENGSTEIELDMAYRRLQELEEELAEAIYS